MADPIEELAQQEGRVPGLARFLTARSAIQNSDLQQQQRQIQQQFIQDRQSLGSNPTPEDLRALGAKYTNDPKSLIDLANKMKEFIPIPPGGLYNQRSYQVIQPKEAGPFSGVHNVPGGYITKGPDGSMVFTKTEQKASESPYSNIQQDPLNPGGYLGFNKATGKMEKVPGGVQVNTQGEGEDVLKGVNPNIAALVRQLAGGFRQPPSSFAQKTPFWENVMGLLSRYDPQYSDTRFTTRKAFTTGVEGRNMTNINQTLSHMGTLKDLADAMQNNDIQAQNRLVSFVRTQMGHPEVTNAELAAHAVSSELMRTFRGVGASDQGTQAFENKLNVKAMSPDQINQALGVGVDLLGGRMDALQHQFGQGMNSDKFTANLLSPKAQAVLQRLGKSQTPQSGQVKFLGFE